MGEWLSFLAKGVKEHYGTKREIYVFGADPGTLDFSGWWGPPFAWDETDLYDLSLITPGHEVLVTSVYYDRVVYGHYVITVTWVRDRDAKVLFQGSSEGDIIGGLDLILFSCIGWFLQEISENGAHHVFWEITGPLPYTKTFPFTVIGIPSEVKPPPVPAEPVSLFVEILNNVGGFFYGLYLKVFGWQWLPDEVPNFFYEVSAAFYSLGFAFADFNTWFVDVTDKIATFLNLDALEAWFTEWKEKLLALWNWLTEVVKHVTTIITNWWAEVWQDVQDFIAVATQGLSDLLVAWHNFWTVLFPNLVNFTSLGEWWTSKLTEITGYIDDKIKESFPWYDDFGKIWDKIKAFHIDPLEWLWGQFADWFLGKE